MSRKIKIILGILFYPYGIYLIINHFRKKNKWDSKGFDSKVDSELEEFNSSLNNIEEILPKDSVDIKKGVDILLKYYEKNKNKVQFVDKNEIIKSKKSFFHFRNKFIIELVEKNEILFGIHVKTFGFVFTDKFFVFVGLEKVIRYDYRVFSDINLKNNSYWINNTKLFDLVKQSNKSLSFIDDIKSIVSKIKFGDPTHKFKLTKHRSSGIFGSISNSFEKYGEKNMNVFEVDEKQKNLKINIINIEKLGVLISENQEEILKREEGQKYLQKFVKLNLFSSKLHNEVLKEVDKVKNTSIIFNHQINQMIKDLKSLNKTLTTVNSISKGLVVQFVNGDMMKFYESYEILDSLGLFNSSFENNLISNLNSIDSKLESLNTNLKYLNIVSTYNTYQLSKIR
jgi:hypothetical protein|tara:strand:+ start:141 stop:1331 length:1191 start_codon:yes stop_codon:yes gene_type:complete